MIFSPSFARMTWLHEWLNASILRQGTEGFALSESYVRRGLASVYR